MMICLLKMVVFLFFPPLPSLLDTEVFNFRRNEVRSFLQGAVFFWAERRVASGFVAGNGGGDAVERTKDQWIGLRENLQETMVFTIKYRGFL